MPLGQPTSRFEDSDDVTFLKYPVKNIPSKSTASARQASVVDAKLLGVKGQYWMFEGGLVWNVRSHAGYRGALEIS